MSLQGTPTTGQSFDAIVDEIKTLAEKLYGFEIHEERTDVADEVRDRLYDWAEQHEPCPYCRRPGPYCYCP